MKPKQRWFDTTCINAKRNLIKAAKKFGSAPSNQLFRDNYYKQKREYRKLINKKKSDFFEGLCKDIEEGRNINWKRFKMLKTQASSGSTLDAFDMRNFYTFFKKIWNAYYVKRKNRYSQNSHG